MKNFTRILALVLACVMLLALTACGGNTEAPAATSGDAAAEAPAGAYAGGSQMDTSRRRIVPFPDHAGGIRCGKVL